MFKVFFSGLVGDATQVVNEVVLVGRDIPPPPPRETPGHDQERPLEVRRLAARPDGAARRKPSRSRRRDR